MKEIDNFYLGHSEPNKSCLLAMRSIIMKYNTDITEAWKYNMPFFCIRGKMFCYFWVDPKINQPYVGFVDGNKINSPALVAGKRTRMKVLYLDATQDLPIKTIRTILKDCIALYKK